MDVSSLWTLDCCQPEGVRYQGLPVLGSCLDDSFTACRVCRLTCILVAARGSELHCLCQGGTDWGLPWHFHRVPHVCILLSILCGYLDSAALRFVAPWYGACCVVAAVVREGGVGYGRGGITLELGFLHAAPYLVCASTIR